jgi:hypothetical protein
MTLRFRAPDGTTSVTFGAGCNQSRRIVDGLLDCPLGERCQCHELALQAGFSADELPDYPGVPVAKAPRRQRKPKAKA